MSLQLIYGKAGTGKTKFCFDQINKNISLENSTYLITPEQFSYTAEKKLLETLNTDSVISAEVLSFNRIANRVFTEVEGATNTHLSKSGKAMLIYNILEKEQKKLKFLGNSNDNVELVLRTITEFKKHNISEITSILDKVNDVYLKTKLTDLNNIFEEYKSNMLGKYIDEDDVLSLLAKLVDKSTMFIGSEIYIDEFSGFTEQEYIIISKLLKQAKQVNITICSDSLDDSSSKENDIFYFNKKTTQRLLKIAKEENVSINNPINLNTLHRFKNNELLHLENNLFAIPYQKYSNEVSNLHLFLALNPYSEIEFVANSIITLVQDEKLHYRDIAIITKNIDSYSSIAKAVFSKYNIPLFIDTSSDLEQNVLIKYILSILEIFYKNWSFDSMFNYLKSGFLDISKNDIYKLENYCIKWGIRGSKWYKKDWNFGDTDMNSLRKQIVEPLLSFKENLSRTKTAKEITIELFNFLKQNNIYEKLQSKIEYLESINEITLANIYKNSLDILISLLDEIILIFADDKMSFEKYINILKTGLKFSSLGKIPSTLDQVTIGDVDRSRNNNVQVVFILGMNDGVFPSINIDEGFLNDSDRNFLKAHNIELAKGSLDLLYENQFNIYKALTTSENELYLSYPSSDNNGKALRPSVIISRIKKMFPKIIEKSAITSTYSNITSASPTFDKLLLNLNKFKEGENIDNIWFEVYNWFRNDGCWKNKLELALKALNYTNVPDNISYDNINKLYGNTLKTSVSKLEQYKRCPFSFYLKYGLHLQDKEEYKIKPINTGSFMHDVIDAFFERTSDNIKTLDRAEIPSILNNIINEKLNITSNYIFNSSAKFIVLTTRLKKVVTKSIEYIVYQIQNSDFDILGNEVEFLEKFDNVEIKGKVDRIDINKTEHGNFIRIIDYKSSSKNIDLNETLAGVQIQLLTYSDIMSKKNNSSTAGVLYFNLIDPIISSNKNLTDEEIEQKIKQNFRMQGLILTDVKVVKMMDNKLINGASDIVPAYISKDGNLSSSRSSVISKEDFTNLQITINKLIKKISKEILRGNINIAPTYNKKSKKSACEFCSYKTICNFNANTNCYSYIDNKSKEQILEEIKSH